MLLPIRDIKDPFGNPLVPQTLLKPFINQVNILYTDLCLKHPIVCAFLTRLLQSDIGQHPRLCLVHHFDNPAPPSIIHEIALYVQYYTRTCYNIVIVAILHYFTEHDPIAALTISTSIHQYLPTYVHLTHT